MTATMKLAIVTLSLCFSWPVLSLPDRQQVLSTLLTGCSRNDATAALKRECRSQAVASDLAINSKKSQQRKDSEHHPSSVVLIHSLSGGGSSRSASSSKILDTKKTGILLPAWFKPGASTNREKWLAFWLLTWNALAATDAFFYTFRPKQTLENYLTPGWDQHALAQSRMLANCQWALIMMSTLTALTGNEKTIKDAFKIMILATLGAFRAVGVGVKEGTIKAPWKSDYTAFMSLPPLLLLSYFAFFF